MNTATKTPVDKIRLPAAHRQIMGQLATALLVGSERHYPLSKRGELVYLQRRGLVEVTNLDRVDFLEVSHMCAKLTPRGKAYIRARVK